MRGTRGERQPSTRARRRAAREAKGQEARRSGTDSGAPRPARNRGQRRSDKGRSVAEPTPTRNAGGRGRERPPSRAEPLENGRAKRNSPLSDRRNQPRKAGRGASGSRQGSFACRVPMDFRSWQPVTTGRAFSRGIRRGFRQSPRFLRLRQRRRGPRLGAVGSHRRRGFGGGVIESSVRRRLHFVLA